MSLYFITSSKHKFEEIQSIIAHIRHIDIDLPEIQDSNPQNIIRNKLQEARKHHDGQLMVEDTSLYFDCLNGLPGPLIKWFLKSIGRDGLCHIAQSFKNTKATAKTIIGYAQSKDEIHFFEGEIQGHIVNPRGNQGFGWDAIFEPEGESKTFAEMNMKEKNELSMRKLAAEKLKQFLNNDA
ncbi:non-canonical purine NTP pyrophosphatase [Candidatus Woesebacteria bacterium]|nr:non-canonical purine NTP pyrophosphatase [Candidatus Woesebacteria bacterium]